MRRGGPLGVNAHGLTLEADAGKTKRVDRRLLARAQLTLDPLKRPAAVELCEEFLPVQLRQHCQQRIRCCSRFNNLAGIHI